MIGTLEQLHRCEALEFELPDGEPAFALIDRGRVRAYRNRCPHRGVTLNWVPGRFLDSDGRYLQCATHGALFRPEDGVCVAGPCVGERLPALAVTIVGDAFCLDQT